MATWEARAAVQGLVRTGVGVAEGVGVGAGVLLEPPQAETNRRRTRGQARRMSFIIDGDFGGRL
jgi:hypothetical protein